MAQQKRAASAAAAALAGLLVTAAAPAPLTGVWGGPDTILTLTAEGGRIEHGCGAGTLGPLRPDASGKVRAEGRLEDYAGGPQRADTAPVTRAASFAGRVEGTTLHLTVTPAGGEPTAYTLVEGRRAKLIRCY